MKILILAGSSRKHGNTDQMLGLIETHLRWLAEERRAALEIETIHLGDQRIEPCRGCRICFDRGEEKCPLKDDLLAIKAKMLAADGVLVASPVYVDDVSGTVKTWIDRLGHVCHRPAFAGKCAYLVATVGSSPTRHALQTLNVALRTWGFYIAGQAGFKMGALMKPAESAAQFRQQAETAARSLFDAIDRRKFARPSFYSLMVFKIQQHFWLLEDDHDTVDYCYWQGQGWLDPRATYYFAHQASPIKVALARLAGRLIAPLVS